MVSSAHAQPPLSNAQLATALDEVADLLEAQVWLEAANPAYESITPQHELTIVAVVRAVVRKYI